jgi:hypothetical protein
MLAPECVEDALRCSQQGTATQLRLNADRTDGDLAAKQCAGASVAMVGSFR